MTKRKPFPWEKKAEEERKREAKRARLLSESRVLMARAKEKWDAAQAVPREADPRGHQWHIGPLTLETGKPWVMNDDSLAVLLMCDECGEKIHARVSGSDQIAHDAEHGGCTEKKRIDAAARRKMYSQRTGGNPDRLDEFTESK